MVAEWDKLQFEFLFFSVVVEWDKLQFEFLFFSVVVEWDKLQFEFLFFSVVAVWNKLLSGCDSHLSLTMSGFLLVLEVG